MNRISTVSTVIKRNQFSTFTGVFTPSILTILGVIMFMRAPFVIGQSGIFGAIAILVIAKFITFLTTLSIGAISTNMQVKGGGAYYLISRVLGPEFGGAIGIALFIALALSVPFYILGFTEALCRSFEFLSPYFEVITVGTAIIFFIISYVGASWALKVQYVIMAILALAIIFFMGGALNLFSEETFRSNISSSYTAITQGAGGSKYSFWLVFAIYFPAVTGIGAGLNMSGDLKNPAKSIPSGTIWAVGVGFVIYLLQIFICGGAFDRQTLIDTPYQCLKDNALLQAGFFVAAGVYAATLSSALGSYLGAPRVLQAVSRDPVLMFLRPFAKGSIKGDEPRRALLLTGVITVGVLFWAGNESEGGALNIVAAVITMFFLYTYGMINFAAFIEALGSNPSFRPSFKYFHWLTAGAGAFGCIIVAFLINAVAAAAAIIIIAGIYWYVRTRQLKSTFGDARRGFVYSSARRNLLLLSDMEEDSRNWRPTILVFSANPEMREILARYAVWMEAGRGIVMLTNIFVGDFEEVGRRCATAKKQLTDLCHDKNIPAFPIVTVADSLEHGVGIILQTASVGPIRPNLVVFGWPKARMDILVKHMSMAAALGKSLVVVHADTLPHLTRKRRRRRIDLWWRGHKNGSVMLTLAWLLTQNWEWENSSIRILRVVEKEAGKEPAAEALRELIDSARVKADVNVIVSRDSFKTVLHGHSSDAACIFLGFEVPRADMCESWHRLYNSFVADLPTTIMVSSGQNTDIL